MLRRSLVSMRMKATAVVLQGWGSGGGGGWGSSDSSSGGGWGTSDAASGGGWGSAPNTPSSADWGSTAAPSGGRWGNAGDSSSQWGSSNSSGGRPRPRGGGGDDGWSGNARAKSSAGGGGWGSKESGGGWGGDSGWGDGASGGRQRSSRGNFRRGRHDNSSGGRGVWGEPAAGDEDAWNAAPPSFQPPVRRIDPLSLTAVEVDVDGVKKLVGQRVQVTGLSDDTTWHTLKDHLRQAGDVTFCRTFSGGRGMVEFATPEEAARCITELQASELEGATLYLREDREDTVLINTRRKIRAAREAQLRARKEEAEKARRAQAVAEGDTLEPPSQAQ